MLRKPQGDRNAFGEVGFPVHLKEEWGQQNVSGNSGEHSTAGPVT